MSGARECGSGVLGAKVRTWALRGGLLLGFSSNSLGVILHIASRLLRMSPIWH